MRAFLDTSVLIPAFYGDHAHHAASLDLFAECDQDGCCAAHSLAEVYSVLTRMPGKHRISCEQTLLFIGSIRERLKIIGLDGDEYAETLAKAAAARIVGGAIYDAILVACALKSGAETIYTWNVRDFARFHPVIAGRVRTP
jgi:predicted nucleic acid-binding protein